MADTDDDGFFGGQELDEFLEELKRRGMFGPVPPDGPPPAPPRPVPTAELYELAGVGRFCQPPQNSWAAHRQVVQADGRALGYWPSHHPFFDNIIHQGVNDAALWDEKRSDFAAYQVLRENLAIVRNYIMCEFFPDGSVDAPDTQKIRHMGHIAELVRDGLNNDRLAPNPLRPLIRKDKANLPGTGAQYIYSQIVKRQNYFSWLDPILHPIAWLKGESSSAWELPELEDSPFSDAALRQPSPPTNDDMLTDEDIGLLAGAMSRSDMEMPSEALNFSEELDMVASDITAASAQYASVQSLKEPTKRESVEIAKDILNKLKLKIGEALIENGLTHFAKENFSIMDALKGAVRVYEFHLHKLMQTDPRILENPAIMAANAAIGKISYLAKQDVLKLAEKSGNKELANAVRKEISKMPKNWQNISERTYGQLLGSLESGLNTVLLRLNQTRKQTGSSYMLGFIHENSQDRPDPSHGYDDASQKALAENAYYQQLNAQRTAQKQAVMGTGGMHHDNGDDHKHAGPNASAKKQAAAQPQGRSSSPFMPRPGTMGPQGLKGDKQQPTQKLVSKEQAAKMRQFMATDANADVVEVNRRQAALRQEMERRQVRQQLRRNLKQAKQNEATHDATEHAAHAKAQAAAATAKEAAHHAHDHHPHPVQGHPQAHGPVADHHASHQAHEHATASNAVETQTHEPATQQKIKPPLTNPNKKDHSRGL